MHVALISIGNGPSLALRNIRRYCLAHEDVRESVTFRIYDYDIRRFRESRAVEWQQWSFVTQFDETVQEMRRTNPDVVAFSCYLWNTELSLHLAHLIKRVMPQVCVVFGGPDAAPRARELLERHSQVDIVVDGDGEIPFLGLVRQQLAGAFGDLEAIPALRYRSGGRVVENPVGAGGVDMSLLRDVYESPPSQDSSEDWCWPYVLYETLRGCPYSCSYCMYGKTPMNEKDPDTAIEELVALLSKGLMINIIDPTFTTYKKRAKRILRGLSAHEYSGVLYIEAYPDSIDEEMADLLVAARVKYIGMGFQTLSSEGLKAVKRPKNLPRFERAVRLLKEREVKFAIDLIYGLPETTVEDFMASVDYLGSLDLYQVVIYRLLGLPGSPMMKDVEKHGLVFSEFPPYELLSSKTYTMEDIMFCEQFQRAYRKLVKHLGLEHVARFTRIAGGVSRLVGHFMDAGVDHPDGVQRALESAMRREPIHAVPAVVAPRRPAGEPPARVSTSLPVAAPL